MKLAVISDIHLDVRYHHTRIIGENGRDPLWSYLDELPGDLDLLVVAGDVSPRAEERIEFWKQVDDRLGEDVPRLFVEGNHEYYGWCAPPTKGRWLDAQLREMEVKGLKIAACTLWFNFWNDPMNEMMGPYLLNDFRMIKGFNAEKAKELFAIHSDFLANSNADIIVTHHAPLPDSIPMRFLGQNAMNSMFSNCMGDFILDGFGKMPRLWIHGHTHDPFDYVWNDMRVVCNPMGYPGENKGLYYPKVIEL